MIYVTGGGADSAAKKPYAVINVVYPAGSACSCTGNGKTLKAPNTLGACTFHLKAAGSYTVTASNGTKTKSKTLSITASGQAVSIALQYELVIFDGSAGGALVPLLATFAANCNATVNSDKIVFHNWGSNYAAASVYTENKIDLSSFNTLCATGLLTEGSLRLGASAEISTSGDASTFVASADGLAAASKTISVDISSINGENYIRTGSWKAKAEISKIWLV